jgi:hypothetical protein
MTAVTDFTQICTILKGSAPTNAQVGKVAALFMDVADNATAEQKAASAIAGMRSRLREMLRENAKQAVYSTALKVAHLPSQQGAMIAAVKDAADAAGSAAEGNL